MAASPLPPDLTDTFEVRRRGPALAIVRPDFAPAFEKLDLLGSGAAPPGSETMSAGRGGAWIAAAGTAGDAVIRPGRRGGWFGRFVRSRYFIGDRFVDEFVLTERLRRRGAPVPEPLAVVRRDRIVGYETWLATCRLPDVEPAATALAASSDDDLPRMLEAMGGAVRALHKAGGNHADLNAWNLLIERAEDAVDPAVHIVDLDRGRLHDGPLEPRRAAGNLERLRRSLRKLELAAALAAWPAFERGYASSPEASAEVGSIL